MIPILYEKSETEFSGNGICRLRDATSVLVTEERNGIYECSFSYPVNGSNYSQITPGRIIAVEHDTTGDIQPFDIIGFTKPINGVVTFHAVHVSYRLSKSVTRGTNITSLGSAINMLREAVPTNPFVYYPDLYDRTGYLASADGTPRTVREFLGGVEGSILDTYGGEYEWDKFMVYLHPERGQRRDLVIRYGVNLVDYEEEYDGLEVYNAVIPFWKGQDSAQNDIFVVGAMQSSGMAVSSGRTECAALDVTDKFETQPTQAQVEAMGLKAMSETQPFLPMRNFRIDFENENNEYAGLHKCNLCDTIRVVFPFYKLDSYFKIVKVTYDVLKERYTSMELGTLSTTLSEALGIGSGSIGRSSGGGGGGGGFVYELTKRGDIITLTGGGESSSVTDSDTKYGLSINGHTVALVAGGSDSSVTVPDDFTTEYETKLSGIEAGAEVNVQSDWNVTDSSSDAYIKNKPTIPSAVQPTTTAPKMDGTANVGSESKYARGDHVHPSDTTKVDKVTGKGLSTNDFTDTLLTKLNGIESGAEVNVNADWNALSGDAQILNKPSIPTKTSELTNDSNFINGNAGGLFYGTCSTAAGTQAKAVTCAEFTSADLVAGTFIVVTFTNTNTGATGGLTLNVNGTGAKPLKYINNGALGNIPSTGYLKANVEYPFYYDGANWVVVMNYNTTYSAMSWSEMETGTATTGRTITATRLKEAVEYHAPVKSVNGQTGAVTISVPDAVSVTQKTTSGTNIADITIGGTTTKLYAPTGGGGGITVLDCYPVGSYYETSDSSFDPNTAWGGTWVLDSKGRVTVSRDETVADFDTIGETGGEKTHTLTVNEMPSHNHIAYLAGGPIATGTGRVSWEYNAAQEFGGSIGYTGGSQAHNNMPPYVVVNRWHRTA